MKVGTSEDQKRENQKAFNKARKDLWDQAGNKKLKYRSAKRFVKRRLRKMIEKGKLDITGL